MLFNSYEFILIFLPVTWGLYQLFAWFGMTTLMTAWLGVASIAFYGYWNVVYVFLLLLSIAANFLLSGALVQVPVGQRRSGKALLTFGIAFNLGLLGYFKYTNFLVDNLNAFAGTNFAVAAIALPIGISFFTFQQIAYLVDVYRRQSFDHSLPKYLLFVAFFPQLIAGPIVHHREMMPQFGRQRRGEILTDAAVGLTIFIVGLFKKVMIADLIAQPANIVFDAAAAGASPSFVDAWAAALCYTFQIYFDFSGYSDMAIGLARMFGVRLPMNFASPYKATSIIDFWRRWHITLSRFLRDYLYIPLGGNLQGKSRRFVNVFITMLLGGIWHGAGWTFVLWGAIHGFLIVANQIWRARRTTSTPGNGAKIARTVWICRLVTFLLIVGTWVPFRANDITAAFEIYSGMIGINGLTSAGLLFPENTWFSPSASILCSGLVVLVWIVWRLPNTQELMRWSEPTLPTHGYPATFLDPSRPGHPIWTGSVRWAATTGVLFALCMSKLSDVSEFIYFRF